MDRAVDRDDRAVDCDAQEGAHEGREVADLFVLPVFVRDLEVLSALLSLIGFTLYGSDIFVGYS